MSKSTRQEVIDAADKLMQFTPYCDTKDGDKVCPYCWAQPPDQVKYRDFLLDPDNHYYFCPWSILKGALVNLD